ncbi:PstS family phosphate ABC transporter substrate-binding protein [Aquirufa sp. ROCK-SH2]
MANMNPKYAYFILFSLLMISSCSKNSDQKQKDGPATGEITIAVDESFQHVLNAEKAAFEDNYHFAKIHLKLGVENESIADLLNDKVRAAIVTRDLTDAEQEIFKREKITYRSFRFAADGIALLVNKSNSDTLINLNQLKNVLLGNLKTWESIGAQKSKGPITLVVDKANSSNIKYLMDLFKIPANASLNVFAAGSNKKVIEYVKEHPNSIGLIGSNWISDGDNPTSLGFIRSVNIMSVAANETKLKEDYFQPFGYNLALKKYPLRREIKIILKESYLGLGTGFVNYVCGDMGQLIVLKDGLIPLTRPITIRQYQISQ